MGSEFLQKSRHNTVYYFRRRLPLDIRLRIGIVQIYRSLNTCDRGSAIVLARRMAAETDALFDVIRSMSDDPKDKLDRLIQRWRDQFPLKQEIDALKEQLLNSDIESRRKIAALKSDHLDQLNAISSGLSRPPVSVEHTMTVQEAVEKMLASDEIKSSTKGRYVSIFSHFAEFVGADSQLHEITPERFTEYADFVNADAVKAEATKRNYITIAARLFNWANERDKRISLMTARGLKPRRSRPAFLDRAAFSLSEVGGIFAHVAQYRHDQPHRFWATVFPAFTGCRISELAQADLTSDFKKDPGCGIWYLDVNENPYPASLIAKLGCKSVKTHAGWRRIPIHSELVKLGFLDFLDAERAAGAGIPFERYWKPYFSKKTGAFKHAHSVIKWAGRELGQLREAGIVTTPKVTYLHSWRHTLTNHLVAKGIGEDLCTAICGQEGGTSVSATVYSKLRTNVEKLSSVLEDNLDEYVELIRKAIATK